MTPKRLERVLFVYPNSGSLRIPLAVAILSAILKEAGVDVRVFDTTFFKIEESLDYALMEKRGVVKKTRLDELMGGLPQVNVSEQMGAAMEECDPDLVLVSVMERHYWLFDILVRACKQARPDVAIIAGGILPTLRPEMITWTTLAWITWPMAKVKISSATWLFIFKTPRSSQACPI